MKLGEKIRYLRKTKPFQNQKTFASEVMKLSDVHGLYQEVISAYENGEKLIKDEHLEGFARFFSQKFGREITVKDLKTLTVEEITNESKQARGDSSKKKQWPSWQIAFAVFLLVSITFTFIQNWNHRNLIVQISDTKKKELDKSHLLISGKIKKSLLKDNVLWIFSERKDKNGAELFWPKGENPVENFSTPYPFSNYQTWHVMIYEAPDKNDPYQKNLAFSAYVIPKNQTHHIDSWFKKSKPLEIFDPFNPNPVLKFRKHTIGVFSLDNLK